MGTGFSGWPQCPRQAIPLCWVITTIFTLFISCQGGQGRDRKINIFAFKKLILKTKVVLELLNGKMLLSAVIEKSYSNSVASEKGGVDGRGQAGGGGAGQKHLSSQVPRLPGNILGLFLFFTCKTPLILSAVPQGAYLKIRRISGAGPPGYKPRPRQVHRNVQTPGCGAPRPRRGLCSFTEWGRGVHSTEATLAGSGSGGWAAWAHTRARSGTREGRPRGAAGYAYVWRKQEEKPGRVSSTPAKWKTLRFTIYKSPRRCEHLLLNFG